VAAESQAAGGVNGRVSRDGFELDDRRAAGFRLCGNAQRSRMLAGSPMLRPAVIAASNLDCLQLSRATAL